MVVKKIFKRKKTVAVSKKKVTVKKKTDKTLTLSAQAALIRSDRRIKVVIPPGRILTAEGWNRYN